MKICFVISLIGILLWLFSDGMADSDVGEATAACNTLQVQCPSPVNSLDNSNESISYRTALMRAFNFLSRKQVKISREGIPEGPLLFGFADYAGNWPQFFYFEGRPDIRVREVSPFIVTFIHHALTHVVEQNTERLGLDPKHAEKARIMRQRAVEFMRLFETRPQDPDRGTFGFWPYDDSLDDAEGWLERRALDIIQGPILEGFRTPVNVGFYPAKLAIPSDADVTATIYAALLDDALLDEGTGGDIAIGQFFSDWRDTGTVPLRLNPEWLTPASGAFLTWLHYRDPPDYSIPNDVDLVVNANVLYALARYDSLETDGAQESIDLIVSSIEQGLHGTSPQEISHYYLDNLSFYYCVSRAFYEGPLPALQPAVQILADELEVTALVREDGTVFWDKGSPHLNTAFAVLTLLNAGRTTSLVDGAIDYLISEQDRWLGNWDESVFFEARSDTGLHFNWVSSSLTTAMVLEALCRFKLAQ